MFTLCCSCFAPGYYSLYCENQSKRLNTKYESITVVKLSSVYLTGNSDNLEAVLHDLDTQVIQVTRRRRLLCLVLALSYMFNQPTCNSICIGIKRRDDHWRAKAQGRTRARLVQCMYSYVLSIYYIAVVHLPFFICKTHEDLDVWFRH